MDIVDRDLQRAETQASLEYSREASEERARRASLGSASSSSTSSSDITEDSELARRATRLSQISTHPTHIERVETQRLQHSLTVGASVTSRVSKKPLPEFGGGKPYPPPLPEREEYVVEFDGHDDPLHPQNWPLKRKVYIGAICAYTCLCSTFASSIFSATTGTVATKFGVSVEVSTLSSSLFVLGYAFGPLVWGPMSELYGRKSPILIAMFGFTLFSAAVATAKDLQTIMLCRFFSGFMGSSPLSVVAAVFADMFNNAQRGKAIAVFSMCVFMGPLFGPFIGGFTVTSYLGWRWDAYWSLIMGAVSFILLFFFLRETYPPVVLVDKAAELRRRTKNWGIHAKQEEVEVDIHELLQKNFSRPIRLLVTEPVLLLVSFYMAFIYGLLYLFLTAYPLVFQGVHGMNPGVGGLPFFGMATGVLIGGSMMVLSAPAYAKKLDANGGIPVAEWRLPQVILGGVIFAAGLFWFGWSGYKSSVHWIVPTLSGLFTGFGLISIFMQLFNYIIDTYLFFAASAIAANTLLRSGFAAGFPLFARQMFNGLGIEWAASLLGFVAFALVPVPMMFLIYGARLRAKSKFAPSLPTKPRQSQSQSQPQSSPPPPPLGADEMDEEAAIGNENRDGEKKTE